MKLEFLDPELNEITLKTFTITSACTSPKIVANVSSRCRFKMHALAKIVYKMKGSYETIAFLLGERMGYAEDIVIPVHEASGGYVSPDAENVRAILPEIEAKNVERMKRNDGIRARNAEITKKNEDIRKANEDRATRNEAPLPEEKIAKELKPLRVVGWTHSHNTMGAFSSGTDDANHKRIHDDLVLTALRLDAQGTETIPAAFYIMGITVNVRKEEFSVAYASFPCGYVQQINNAPVVEFDDGLPFDMQEKESIIADLMNEVAKKVKTSGPRGYSWYQPTTTTSTLDRFIFKKETTRTAAPEIDEGMINENFLSKIAEDVDLETFAANKAIANDIIQIHKACGGKESKIYQSVKDLLKDILGLPCG
jgi:hypothetical protein